MSVLFIVVPLALLASAAAVFGFVWAIRRGQLDDLTTPAYRMLERDAAEVASSPGVRSAGNSVSDDERTVDAHDRP